MREIRPPLPTQAAITGKSLPMPTTTSDRVPVAVMCSVYDETGRLVAHGRVHRAGAVGSGAFTISFGGEPFEVPADLPAARLPSGTFVVYVGVGAIP